MHYCHFTDKDIEVAGWRSYPMIIKLVTMLRSMSALLQIWTDCLFLLQKALAYDINNQIRVIYIGG